VHRLTERHRRVLETVTDAIVITGLDGRIAFANAAANTLFRTSELTGQHVASLTAPESLEEVVGRERAAREGLQQRYECDVLCADGARRRVAVSSAPLFEVGEVTGTVACLRDVTEQRADAEALSRSEARYERLFESASDAIFTVGHDGRFQTVNRGLLIATGMTREALVGQPCTLVVDPRDHARVEELLSKTFAGERQRQQLRYLGAQGLIRMGVITTSPIMESGLVVGGLGIMRDNTDDLLLRETDAQRARLATAEELLQGSSDPAHTNFLAHLLDADTERYDSTGTIDADDAVRRAIELHEITRASHDDVTNTSLDGALPIVRGDARCLHQALINLLTNAADAVAESRGERRIHVATRREGERVLIEVSDTGHGIAPADLSRVFKPMFTTRFQNGRKGFGLTIARQLIEANGGTLGVRSSLGEGTTFTVALPIGPNASA
jgi:PAS domain S-box-containing protein